MKNTFLAYCLEQCLTNYKTFLGENSMYVWAYLSLMQLAIAAVLALQGKGQKTAAARQGTASLPQFWQTWSFHSAQSVQV